ncbi:MAG: toll/interleukin-1 receptor domain-containing protein [Methanomicrobia archaeon]|nr:toll/interleukin-1 receptor domain-containing protein [Methanomicrobia archaeon]
MNKKPGAFLSYSHVDKNYATRIAKDLSQNGIDVWFDKWEISPGDSLIQKIFSEGLADSDFFLILLSASSTQSKWVTEELDAAIVNKITGVIRIIPIIIESCNIPLPLRSLRWVDLSKDYDEGILTLLKAMHRVSEKPPVGTPPNYVTSLKQSVGGLSKSASTIGFLLLSRPLDSTGFEKSYHAKVLQSMTPFLSADDLNDAVDELESYGLVKTIKVSGTAPYSFFQISPTYALYLHFKEDLDYDPYEDIKAVASAVAAKGKLNGDQIQFIVKLPPVRINRAVSYLEDYGMVQVLKYSGTAPYNFGQLIATRHTRNFVQENCK